MEAKTKYETTGHDLEMRRFMDWLEAKDIADPVLRAEEMERRGAIIDEAMNREPH